MDILQEFNTKVGSGETSKHGFVDRVTRIVRVPEKEADIFAIGRKIKSVKGKVDDLSRRRGTYGITTISDAGEGSSNNGPNNGSSISELRRTSPYADGEHLVGFEDVKNILLKELLKPEVRRSVISIYGMGGLGKTTLARELYKSVDNIEGGFDYRVWVCVSQKYSIKVLLRNIIRHFKGWYGGYESDRIESMNEAQLENYIRNFLQNKKYLIVVDDVWRQEDWQSLQKAFPDCSNRSRVIITTRNEEVAKGVNDKTFAHHLRFLNETESLDLFNEKISQRDGHANWLSPQMHDVGREMVKKCRGLPLAIIVLGGLLSNKRGLSEWKVVKETLWRNLKEDSIQISFLFSLSYEDLSSPLKKCFLYVGIFPEDHEFRSEKLMQLWMAEGFVHGNDMEYEAQDILDKLIGRSLIQVAEVSWRGIEACRIHDLLRDLVVAEAMKSKLFDIYDPRVYKNTAPYGDRLRLAIHHNDKQDIDGHFTPGLKSLVFFNVETIDRRKLKAICKKFKDLSVLYQETSGSVFSRGLCPEIKNLSCLKLLSLRRIESLPKTVGQLKSLQTLELEDTSKFPEEVSELINLRHLKLQLYKESFRLDTLTNLRTLKVIRYDHWVDTDAANLVNLQELSLDYIWQLQSKPYTLDSVRNLRNLTTLSLASLLTLPPLEPLFYCENLFRLSLEGGIAQLPPFEDLPQCLEALKLESSQLRKDPMPTLEKLSNLKILYLDGTFLVNKITCRNNGFRQLEHLSLYNLPNFKTWILEEGAMPVIRSLTISKCPKLMTIPGRLKPIACGVGAW